MAIALRPKLLIADEPTTAVDVTTQAALLKLLQKLVDEDGMGMMFITHDLAVVADIADTVAIMRQGEVVEAGPTLDVFRTLKHPYSRALFEASSHLPPRIPPRSPAARRCVAVDNVVREYRLKRTLALRRAAGAPRRRRRQPSHRARRERRARRRERLRQVDARPRHHGARADPGRLDRHRRPADRSADTARPSRRAARCRWCSRTPTARSIRATASTG